MARYIDTIVIGAGATGSAAAWQLAGRGGEVVVFEREGAEATASGGVVSLAPFTDDALTLRLATDATGWWSELESRLGRRLLDTGSAVWVTGSDSPPRVVGVESELLDEAAATREWPGIRFPGSVLHVPRAVRLDAGVAVRALRDAARDAGAELRYRERVTRIRVLGDDRALVEVAAVDAAGEPVDEQTTEFECRRLVVTVGAHTTKLAGGVLVLPRLVVTQQQPGRFPLRGGAAAGEGPWRGSAQGADAGRVDAATGDEVNRGGELRATTGGAAAGEGSWRGSAQGADAGRVDAATGGAVSRGGELRATTGGAAGAAGSGAWPIWRHDPVVGDPRSGYWRGSVWGAPAGDGVEVVWSAPGAAATPDAAGFRSERRRRTALQHYVREWLPGLDHEHFTERGEIAVSTRDGRAVIDRVGPVIVATALSHLGSGFAPAVGALLADLADGVRAPAAFSLRADRRASTTTGAPASASASLDASRGR